MTFSLAATIVVRAYVMSPPFLFFAVLEYIDTVPPPTGAPAEERAERGRHELLTDVAGDVARDDERGAGQGRVDRGPGEGGRNDRVAGRVRLARQGEGRCTPAGGDEGDGAGRSAAARLGHQVGHGLSCAGG